MAQNGRMALTHRSSDFALDSPPGDFLPQEIELLTIDGVWINAGWVPIRSMDESRATFVLAHGFTGSWREPRVQAVMAHLARFGNVLAIDQRGHGRSTGLCTIGMDEVLDVDAAVERTCVGNTHGPHRPVSAIGRGRRGRWWRAAAWTAAAGAALRNASERSVWVLL